ncbi:MAG TPA: helix-turn-helix domain-containing protein [Solirubrobacterales bacterium]|nr:helix-turn-helix domain-containing protein [Solirubrobacterales bacterium]
MIDAGTVEVLHADPDLAVGVDPAHLAAARHACLAARAELPRGDWDPATASPPAADGFGLLLLAGFLVRRVGRGGRFGAELVGPGDLLRPWQTIGAVASTPFEPSWRVVAPAELAVLDADFVARAAPYPSVAIALVDRAMLRARQLALTMAVVQQTRVDRRLHALLWQLADRWGRTGRDGVSVEVPLTHELLAELVAARRPSVTTALSALAAAGQVERQGGRWLLRGGPPEEIVDLL